MNQTQYVIEAIDLVKVYRNSQKHALDGLSLQIPDRQVFGILGPNGAGKTTFLKSIVGLVKFDKGKLSVLGNDNYLESIPQIGFVPEDGVLYHYLTGYDFLEFIGGIRGLSSRKIKSQIEKYHDILELPNLKLLIGSYSKGNKEKILFLSALLHEPKILILDEPFTGFDPLVFKKVKNLIKEYASLGNTVILSTHILEVVSQLCQQIAIIVNGKIKSKHILESGKNIGDGFSEIESIYLSTIEG
ncbi:MAG: ABC transporter ATP-binding protein [Firmicutes bacterium]|nr:ABC transporter ATP-binding protein [Bacillota bacterium]